jgi:beta-lactamase regulating signal transducer with metallopeptidase domain
MELTSMHWIAGLPQMAASALISSVWQGMVLAAGVGLCLRLLPRTTAAVRSSAWTAVFAVLALLPFFYVFAAEPAASAGTRGAMLHVDVRWSYAIAGLWLALSLYRAAQLAISAFRLRAIWKRTIPVDAGAACVSHFADAGLRKVQICTSVDVSSPSVIGFFSPRILIPTTLFESLTAPELEQIVLHEMGHLRRGDDWINLLQKLGLVLFPLNPVLMWIERRLCVEREMACDDDVLRVTRAPKAYAQCLTNLAEQRLDQPIASLSLGAWERQSELSRRIYSILRRGEGMGRTQARVVLGVLVLALLGGATEVSRCPGIVSFGPPSGASPLAANDAQVLPVAQYYPTASPLQGSAHETLLRASMPVSNGANIGPNAGPDAGPNIGPNHAPKAVAPIPRQRNHHAHAPALHRAKGPVHKQQQQHWVVLTSWSETGDGGVPRVSHAVLTVVGERNLLIPSVSESADGGWLVIQL